jgi:U3 small nucleolar RNA-associated protein 21
MLHRAAQLLALACADLRVRVFDVAPANPARVRLLPPAGDALTALAFSADARWLLSASLDGLTRIYDLPAGRLLQALRLGGGPCTALALAPEMDMLATAHMGKRCVACSCCCGGRPC